MKILKFILFGLIGILLLGLLAAAFIPKKMDVEVSVIIDKPVVEVFDYVKKLKNQDKFSVWMQVDPHMQKTYMGMDGTVGAVSKWKSTNSDVGQGEQEIKTIVPNKRIDYELRFIEPFQSTDRAYMITDQITSSQTKVIWGFNSVSPYPMNLVVKIMGVEQMLSNQLQEGLRTLKKQMEE
ncbi:hypothetical protein GCM10007049_26690 [Echinicola pacifica]|uniref:Polyketide cyclase / dehydrase and lipid transport n=1 Tax=Echinicola pacifica TaxID=346377 RepID=A0A918UT24_9BACT|nr:SRPBCC family protein [Echinicola pacifica]GGZ31976.1 hypothetical protein GCM10007049_26690 [Echinicola pacifica]